MNTLDLTWRVLKSRWLVLAAGLCIESIAGAAYAFGVYSQSLKLALGYDQKRLDTLAFYKAIGANVGVLAGLLYSVVPPWIVILIGAVECAFGYYMLWLSVTGRISPTFWQMCIFICMAANSNTFFSTATVVTNVKNFPKKRGLVIGLLKGFLGLSGAILTPVFYAVYPNDPSSFLLLISWLPAAVAILLMAVIRVLPASEEDNSSFTNFSTIATCLAAYLTVVIILEKVWSDQTWLFRLLCLPLLLFLLSLFVVVIKAELKEGCADSARNRMRDQNVITEPLLSNQNSEQIEDVKKESASGVDEAGRDPRRGAEHTLSQAVSSLDFWLLAVIMFCSMGSGTTAIDNMGQIGTSLGYKEVEIKTFVSLISIWNFLGRFGAGLVSDILLHLHGMTRPWCLAFSLGLMCIGHLVMASAVQGSLYVGSIIVGVCYGAQWSLMPAITSELFGLRHFGTLYNTITISNPVAAYILSVKVAGYLYDREAQKQQDLSNLTMWLQNTGSEDPLLCQGPSCFRISFIILAISCACGPTSLMNKNLESRFRSAGLVSTFVETDSDGTTVHCWIPKGRSGNFKPAFVMLHGFGSTTVWQWYKKISELQSFFAIYVSDLLFCGQSFTPKPERTETFQAECVMEVLKSLGVLEFNLPGISFGEFVAFRMAYVFPAAVQRVIISSSGVLMTLEDYVDLASRGHVNVVAELLLPISPEALLEASKLVISRPPKLPHFLLQGFWSKLHADFRSCCLSCELAGSLVEERCSRSRPVVAIDLKIVQSPFGMELVRRRLVKNAGRWDR